MYGKNADEHMVLASTGIESNRKISDYGIKTTAKLRT